MAKGINKVILVGNCGNDPETKEIHNGQVTNISVATSESWNDKKTGNKGTRTEWHRVVFFNQLAKIAGDYLRKGSQVYIEGSIRTRKWQADDGTDRYFTEIVAKEMQMLGSKVDTSNYGEVLANQGRDAGHPSAPRAATSSAGNFPDDYMPF